MAERPGLVTRASHASAQPPMTIARRPETSKISSQRADGAGNGAYG